MDPKRAFEQVLRRCSDNLKSWVHTLKSYTIFQVALQTPETSKLIAELIHERSTKLNCFNKSLEADYRNLYNA